MYLNAKQAQQRMGKAIGAPICGRYGHVLGRPGMSTKSTIKLSEHYAASCPSYGKNEPMPSRPQLEGSAMIVALPDPATLNAPQNAPEKITSCMMCKFFVKDDIVNGEFGWPVGLCSRKGQLILPNDKVSVASTCDLRSFPMPGEGLRKDVDGIRLYPWYEDNFGALDPVKEYFKKIESFTEPAEYPTDKEVTTEDEARGIRAWRKIIDQAGTGNEAFLPVYDPSKFDDHWKRKIPRTGDDEHPEDYVDHNNAVYKIAVLWTELDETPALWGMAGVGKTEIFRHLAWMMCLPFERLSVTESTELDDLAGKMHLDKEKGTYFQYGRLPVAWSHPCVMVIDEPNVGRPEVWQFIRPLTDNSKQLVLDMNQGEAISRNDDAYLGMAMNPAWDTRNVGAAPISDADGSRLMHIYMTLPPEALEREIIKRRCEIDGWEIPKDMLDMVMKIAADVRVQSEQDTLEVTWGIRPQIKVARALRWFDPVTAYRMAAADFLEPQQQDILLDQVRAHDTSS